MMKDLIDSKHESKPGMTSYAKPGVTSYGKPGVGSNLALGIGLPLIGDTPYSSAVMSDKYQQPNETSQTVEEKILGNEQRAQRIQESNYALPFKSYNKGSN